MTFNDFATKKISLSALFFGVSSILLLTQLLRLLPNQFYFTFSGFVFGNEEQPDVLSVVFKLGIPAIAGGLLGFVWEEDGIDVAPVAGFVGAFVLAWPAIMLWEFVVSPALVEKRNAFLVLYILYGLSYSCLCRLFSFAGLQLRAKYHASGGTGISSLNWKSITETVVATVICTGLQFIWGHVYVSSP